MYKYSYPISALEIQSISKLSRGEVDGLTLEKCKRFLITMAP